MSGFSPSGPGVTFGCTRAEDRNAVAATFMLWSSPIFSSLGPLPMNLPTAHPNALARRLTTAAVGLQLLGAILVQLYLISAGPLAALGRSGRLGFAADAPRLGDRIPRLASRRKNNVTLCHVQTSSKGRATRSSENSL